MEKKGYGKIKLDQEYKEIPVYLGNKEEYIVKVGNYKNLPRNTKVKFNGEIFNAELNYRFNKPVYLFKPVKTDEEYFDSNVFNVGKLGERNNKTQFF